MQTLKPAVAAGAELFASRTDRMYWSVLILLPALAAVAPIGSAFWLDETMTYWTIRGGFADIARRCTVSPHSILYSSFMWAVDQIAGHGEIVFRLPSVAAMAAAAYILYRLARDEFGREAALTAVVLLASSRDVMYAAGDARPYTIGVMAVATSSFLLLTWMHSGRLLHGLMCAALAAIVVHMHFLFAPVLGAFVLFFTLAERRDRIRPAHAAIVILLFTALVAPLGPQFMEAARTRAAHSFSPRPGIADLFWGIFPVYGLVWGGAIAAMLATAWPLRLRKPAISCAVLWFMAASALLPPLVLWVISVTGETRVFIPRFLLSSAPGAALLFAVLLQALDSRLLRRWFLAIPVLTSVAGWCWSGLAAKHCKTRGDWRSALAFVERETTRDSAPVLVRSQYIESDFMDWRSARLDDSILFTPLAYYSARANFVPLPASMQPAVASYLDAFAAAARTRNQRFLLMSYPDPRPLPPFLRTLRSSLPSWRVVETGNFEEIRIYEFRPQ